MRWKDKSNTTVTNLAGDDVFPLTDVSTDQDKKATINVIAGWVVTKFTTSVAGATQTIVAAINAVRTMAQNAATAAATAQSGVDANTEAIQTANGRIDTNATNIAGNTSSIATLDQEMGNTNVHVDELQDQVGVMQELVDEATAQAQEASATAIDAANAASEAAEAVQEIIDQGGMVLSVFGRSGLVTAESGDYTSSQITHGEGTVADKLTFDAVPIINSKKAVESGGVFTELNKKVSKAGDKMTGRLRINTNDQSTTPSSNVYGHEVRLENSSGQRWGMLSSHYATNGESGAQLEGDKTIGGTEYYNAIRLLIDTSGNAVVRLYGNNVAAAWRNAIGAVASAVSTYDYTKFTYETNFDYYATSGSNAPYASKQGRVVTLAGNFKNTAIITTSGDVVIMGKVPQGCEPLREMKFIQHGSDVNKFILTVRTNGDIGISRYGSDAYVNIPVGAWLNISCTYISAS